MAVRITARDFESPISSVKYTAIKEVDPVMPNWRIKLPIYIAQTPFFNIGDGSETRGKKAAIIFRFSAFFAAAFLFMPFMRNIGIATDSAIIEKKKMTDLTDNQSRRTESKTLPRNIPKEFAAFNNEISFEVEDTLSSSANSVLRDIVIG